MVPTQLQADSFRGYSREAERVAETNLPLLQQLPLGFVPFLLKEIIAHESKFPAERRELDAQLAYLTGLTMERRRQEMAAFAGLRMTPALQTFDWVNSPGRFLELLSAYLWATHQMDIFRTASEEYVHRFYAQLPPQRLPVPRLGIAVIGLGVTANRYPLFRKLRRQGVYYGRVKPDGAWPKILEVVEKRAKTYPSPYAHWYIDGGPVERGLTDGLTCISYQALAPVRNKIVERMRSAYESPQFGAEALRTTLARMRPEDLGMSGSTADAALNRFQVSLLTEGSGTQIYSTTFVQWAAREAYRRAQPVTLLARFAPRTRERPMNELLSDQASAEVDAPGSLIDADMGAYYTWLNQQRLSGAENASFLVWFEKHSEAVAVGPGLARGTENSEEIDISSLLERVAREA
ncbi:MAG: hypothetical protein M3Y57_04810 [Acidobacteriota bacterium]|nr:hypothetical protein [Acidobacteriota bacterium]